HDDLVVVFLFFFSSRRRHTRSKRDWSSDVCSSDLGPRGGGPGRAAVLRGGEGVAGRPASRREVRAPAGAARRPLRRAADPARVRSEERRVGKEWRARRATVAAGGEREQSGAVIGCG